MLSPETLEDGSGGAGFRLYDSIREYAAERAEEQGVTQAAEERHRDFYLEQGEQRIGDFGAPDAEELAWFTGNRENLLALVHRFSGTEPTAAGRAACAGRTASGGVITILGASVWGS